jgi:Ribonuclease G/E
MKGRMILCDAWAGREAAALVQDGRLDDLLIDDDRHLRPGSVLRAVCDRPLKGQGGMMVRLPDGLTGWLRDAKGMRAGQAVTVQVTGVPVDGKAVPLTDRVLLKSRYVIVTPGAAGLNLSRQIADEGERDRLRALAEAVVGPEFPAILRSAAEGATEADLTDDLTAMAGIGRAVMAEAGDQPELLVEGDGPHRIAWREWQAGTVDDRPGSFARNGIDDQIAALRRPVVALDEGEMVIEPTRALIAIDVNSGGDHSPAAGLKVNMAAARALPKALRLRGLGGQIVVDFVSIPKGQRAQLEQSLKSVFRADPVETSLVGWTAMGLYELSRKRERLPLADLLKGG